MPELRGTKQITVSGPTIAGRLMDRVAVVSDEHYARLVAENARLRVRIHNMRSKIGGGGCPDITEAGATNCGGYMCPFCGNGYDDGGDNG